MPETSTPYNFDSPEHPVPNERDKRTYELEQEQAEMSSASIHNRKGMDDCRTAIAAHLALLQSKEGGHLYRWTVLSCILQENATLRSIRKSSFRQAEHMRKMRVTIVFVLTLTLAGLSAFFASTIGAGLYVNKYTFEQAIPVILDAVRGVAWVAGTSIVSFYFGTITKKISEAKNS